MSKAIFPKSILQFDSLSGYLGSYYQFRKNEGRKFSYESWARSLDGINRALLKQIVDGSRTLPSEKVPTMASYFKFNREERTHFLDLVAATTSVGRKSDLRDKIAGRVKYYDSIFMVQETEKFLTIRELPVLATILGFKDAPRTAEGLAEVMGVDKTKVAQWLVTLENLGYGKMTEGTWENFKNNFLVPGEVGSKVRIQHHKESLEHTIKVTQMPEVPRHNEILHLALSPEDYKDFLDMQEQFIDQVLTHFDSDKFEGKKMYQVNLALSPSLLPES